MARPRSRILSFLAALALSLGTTFAVGVAAAPAAGAGTGGGGHGGGSGHILGIYTPLGFWNSTVTTATGDSESVQVLFAPGGLYFSFTPDGAFQGTWRQTGHKTFTFAFTRPLSAPNGAVIGTLDIRHNATFTSWYTFTSTGTATAYDPSGNVLFSGPVSSTGSRF